jgi:hypothetical protein
MNEEDAVPAIDELSKQVEELKGIVLALVAAQEGDAQQRENQARRDKEQERVIHVLGGQLEALQRDMDRLERARLADAFLINNLAQANSMEHVVSKGLEDIREQLEPLRDLTPARTRLDAAGEDKLVAIQAEQKRPAWNREAGPEHPTTALGRRQL